ncbi:hypothetical protein Hanom_Chr07g00653761 [Helianthus anomalus]
MVGHGARIKEELFLKWRGKTLKIWVEEDDKDWISDFVDEVDDVQDAVPIEELELTPANFVNMETGKKGNC